jgi:predicted nucleotidyltransferase
MVDKSIIEIVNKYIKLLKNNNIPILGIYLYGSYANNNSNKDSDIDLLIVTDNNVSKLSVGGKAWALTSKVDFRIEPVVVSENDFNSNENLLVEIVKKEGLLIQ